MTARQLTCKGLVNGEINRRGHAGSSCEVAIERKELVAASTEETKVMVRLQSTTELWRELSGSGYEKYTDVNIHFDGGLLSAHRGFLHGYSVFLNQLLYPPEGSDLPRHKDVHLILPGVKHSPLESFLSLLYHGTVLSPKDEVDDVKELFKSFHINLITLQEHPRNDELTRLIVFRTMDNDGNLVIIDNEQISPIPPIEMPQEISGPRERGFTVQLVSTIRVVYGESTDHNTPIPNNLVLLNGVLPADRLVEFGRLLMNGNVSVVPEQTTVDTQPLPTPTPNNTALTYTTPNLNSDDIIVEVVRQPANPPQQVETARTRKSGKIVGKAAKFIRAPIR